MHKLSRALEPADIRSVEFFICYAKNHVIPVHTIDRGLKTCPRCDQERLEKDVAKIKAILNLPSE